MDNIVWLFTKCWELMGTNFNLFGYVMNFQQLFIFSMICGIVGLVVNGLSD